MDRCDITACGVHKLDFTAHCADLDASEAEHGAIPRDHLGVKGTKISIRRLIRSNVRRCAASSHHGRKDVVKGTKISISSANWGEYRSDLIGSYQGANST